MCEIQNKAKVFYALALLMCRCSNAPLEINLVLLF